MLFGHNSQIRWGQRISLIFRSIEHNGTTLVTVVIWTREDIYNNDIKSLKQSTGKVKVSFYSYFLWNTHSVGWVSTTIPFSVSSSVSFQLFIFHGVYSKYQRDHPHHICTTPFYAIPRTKKVVPVPAPGPLSPLHKHRLSIWCLSSWAEDRDKVSKVYPRLVGLLEHARRFWHLNHIPAVCMYVSAFC